MAAPLLRPLTVLFCGIAAGSTPLATSSFLVNIHRPRADNNVSAIQTQAGNLPVFNADYATRELKSVLVKYSQAQQFFDGMVLQRDRHPEAGYPLFEPPSFAGDLSVTNSSSVPVQAAADPEEHASDIIAVPFGPETAQMALKDYISGPLDVLYYGPTSLGTPAQTLGMDIDTGSADLWIPVNCDSCENQQFASKRSSSFKGSTSRCAVTYVAGKVSGTIAHDVVAVGRASVPQQGFCAVHKESDSFNGQPMSGLIGLAFGTIAQTGEPTFFENLLAQKKVSESIFSVHLTRLTESGSQVCFGCIDPTRMMGPIRWHSLLSRTYWSIGMDGLSVNTTEKSVNAPLTAAVDTGTSLIYMPEHIAESFYAMIPGSAIEYGTGFYTIPCHPPIEVTFNLSGQAYVISPKDFNLGRKDEESDVCIGGIIAMGSGVPNDLVILGDVFLKSWYSVFDYSGRVGFAPSINNR